SRCSSCCCGSCGGSRRSKCRSCRRGRSKCRGRRGTWAGSIYYSHVVDSPPGLTYTVVRCHPESQLDSLTCYVRSQVRYRIEVSSCVASPCHPPCYRALERS